MSARRLDDLDGHLVIAGWAAAVRPALEAWLSEQAPAATLSPFGADTPSAPDAPQLYLVLPSLGAAPGVDEALAFLDEIDAVLDAAEVAQTPVLLASSLEVIGDRQGTVLERALEEAPPFPNTDRRDDDRWDPGDERAWLKQALDDVAARKEQAHVLAGLIEDAKAELLADHEPTTGTALQATVARRKERWYRSALAEALTERARGWGFATPRALALALAEQQIAARASASTIVRLAALTVGTDGTPGEVSFRALADAMQEGARPRLGSDLVVDVLPVDVAAQALAVAAAGLVSGRGEPLVHACHPGGTAVSLTGERLLDLAALYLRDEPTDPIASPADMLSVARQLLKKAGPMLREAALAAGVPDVGGPSSREEARRLGVPARTAATRIHARKLRMLARRLAGAADDLYRPDQIDWRRYVLDELMVEATTAKATAPRRPRHRFDSLVHLLEEMAARHGKKPALTLYETLASGDVDTSTVTYEELLARAKAAAIRLRAHGVLPGDRVVLSGHNHPDWAIVAFGVLGLGARLVPVDPALLPDQLTHILKKARPSSIVVDAAARRQLEPALDAPPLDLHLSAQTGPSDDAPWGMPASETPASVLFTSGTTGDPKGVVLTHQNFTALLASLGEVFETAGDDRALSVLPLHHTLEFTCGLMLPLSAGAQVFYPGELSGERVLRVLREAKITGMVGVPAVWQLLDRRLRAQVAERGPRAQTFFDLATRFNRKLGQVTGADVGKVLFKQVHDELGGHLRLLISGGAALPADTHQLFAGLGLHLAEGYGLTETAPVLTVAEGAPGAAAGTVGRAIPGVEIRIDQPDASGVGEVLARGPNVMQGYFEDADATAAVLDGEGWLRTGDLGRLDDDGRLVIAGRAKEVVVTSSGENLYLDDIETQIGQLEGVAEWGLVGVDDHRGGEKLALAWVATTGVEPTIGERTLKQAFRALPATHRPAIVERLGEPLPRTATRKVKRKAVRALLEARAGHRDEVVEDAPPLPASAPVRGAIALVAGVDVGSLSTRTELSSDLSFDSLMWVELSTALEPIVGRLDAEQLYACETVGQLEALVLQQAHRPPNARPAAVREAVDADDDKRLGVPWLIKAPARAALGRAQRDLYQTLFTTRVEGRANIPYNRPAIVVANHSSHLDTGLVKFALGRYAERLRPLAAADYFFEGNPLKVAFFEHLTNLVPLDRSSGSGAAFDVARDLVERGEVVLIYPEGSRGTTGKPQPFKPLVGRLSLATGAPVLPLYLRGAYAALPKGAMVPHARDLRVTIGRPIEASELAALTEGLGPVQAARRATQHIEDVVDALRQNRPAPAAVQTNRRPASASSRPTE